MSAPPAQAMLADNLRDRAWKRFVRGPDPELLEDLYVPMLSAAVRYDRCCAYFSSSVMAAAARGFGRLIERLAALGPTAPHPAVRLVVNEELDPDDVQAMVETGNLDFLEKLLLRRFKPVENLRHERERLAMLGWLVQQGLLEVRVGVMRRGFGIVHAKFGIATDGLGDAIVFSGSGNETAMGLQGNYERLEVSPSWLDQERYHEHVAEFEDLWADHHPTVRTVSLPDAVRYQLLARAPKDPPVHEPGGALERQREAMRWHFITEAPYLPNGGEACDATALVDLWPHQRRVVLEAAGAWPAGRLLCDEVGMGKTIEAILILRRLLAGRGVKRALLLLPAGLLKQWQAELREKGGLLFPRLEGTNTLIWPDDRTEKVDGIAAALQQDLLLLSRETARTESNQPLMLAAPPWDLVVLDEAHAARRRKGEEGEFNSGTLLLDLLRRLQLKRRARGLLLLSATPMQLNPWEPWDLLAVLGEGGRWLAEFDEVRQFYESLGALRAGRLQMPDARRVAALVKSDPDFPPLPAGQALGDVATQLVFAPPGKRAERAEWLRHGAPLMRRMHRNTRATLRTYYAQGLIDAPPPVREVHDIHFDYDDAYERRVYDALTDYVEKRFTELEHEKPGKGFVMTIYRRRLASSPFAIERSLERRREGLRRVADLHAFDDALDVGDAPEDLDPDDLPDTDGARVSSALPSSPQAARAELLEVERLLNDVRNLNGRDTKRDHFFDYLKQVRESGVPVLVFTGYRDTLVYLRELLVGHYGKALGCYSGDGGERWDGAVWQVVTKDEITAELRDGKLQVLICTDAASEGLNLQAAGALINYDLPWNPSKVEQRIGRIDRIGQKAERVQIINLFLINSIDDRVYQVLRNRCGLFETFVGEMQPVLEMARRMLRGQSKVDLQQLESAADNAGRDALAREQYGESAPSEPPVAAPALTRGQLLDALTGLDDSLDVQVRSIRKGSRYALSGAGIARRIYGARVDALEHDRAVWPLSPLDERLRELSMKLTRGGERLPLVVGTAQRGGFRIAVAVWVGGGKEVPVERYDQLVALLAEWDGAFPEPGDYLHATENAQATARASVSAMEQQAAQREAQSLDRQLDAAKLRLNRELGRFLVCLGEGTGDLNALLEVQMQRETPTAQRLRRCVDRLGGYPDWPDELRRTLAEYADDLSEARKRGRLIGRELDAALDDPRWMANS